MAAGNARMPPSLPTITGYTPGILKHILAPVVIAAASLTACHATTRPAPPSSGPHQPQPGAAVSRLRQEVDALLAPPTLAHGYWGVLVKSLNSGETLYALNQDKLMLPASNMKIVTVAAAAEKLGWDFRYDTRVFSAGVIANGVLDGDLIVAGSGDPSLVAADGMAQRVFADWAARLKARGIRVVSGRIIGDDNGFEEPSPGLGWMWDDLPTEDSTSIGPLQYNENAVAVTVSPGPSAGDSAAVSLSVADSGLTIVNGVTTSAAGTATSIAMHRLPGSTTLTLQGSIPVGAAASVTAVSVDNPTQFFVNAFRAALIANGIDVRGPAVDIDDVIDAPAARGAPIVSYQSAPLSTLAVRLMKISQNLYAESFLKSVGGAPGVVPTAAAGWSAARMILEGWGVRPGALIQRDGSGLTRYDLVTPEALVTILTHVDRDARLKEPFEASLPIAGRDGSLRNRMKNTAAEGNARAKTGSMTAVRGLSGYVTSADGERLVFSILANNFDTPADTITATSDAIVVHLAQFKR
jgi:D-alanyl-D-alanine carboxypeptidase/D-alanyl-D-alanine-endopeptidase (penicillin-binding protein 4)